MEKVACRGCRMTYAPIVLFVYNRPWHTRQTVDALLRNAEARDSDLVIFSDGPKDEASTRKVDEVRQYLRSIDGFKSIRIVEHEKNLGLADNIISGVTEVVNEYGRIIVLEDDMVTSPYFLQYMNDGLNCYEDDDCVISIHGYSFPIQALPETFFIKGASCWGWATWKRGWNLFEPDGSKLLSELEQAGLMDRFDLFGAYPYRRMLEDQVNGRNDSWAVRWYASALLADKLTLHPGQSLLMNIGLDGSGSHCGSYDGFDSNPSCRPITVGGIDVAESQQALEQWVSFFRKIGKGRMASIKHKFMRMFGKAVGS